MKPRVKMHDMPGDLAKHEKIAMREGRHPDRKRAKTFRNVVKMRERATLKRQSSKEIEEQLCNVIAVG